MNWKLKLTLGLFSVLSAMYVYGYLKAVFFSLEYANGSALWCFTEPRLMIWEPFIENVGARSGWGGYLLTDPPEGTRPLLVIESWIVATAGVILMLTSGALILKDLMKTRIKQIAPHNSEGCAPST